MMEKYSLFSGRDSSGAPLTHLIEPGTRYGLNKTAGLGSTSEHLPEVQELVESLKPQAGRLYILNSALGAGEYVGFNLRDDWFTEEGLVHEPPGWHDIPVWDIDKRRRAANWEEEVPGWGKLCWGYPSFYNANRYHHHANQDDKKTRGRVLGAFWDKRMRRVVLVSEVVEELCKKWGVLDTYERIKRGDFPDTSMGARVPGDLCSYCGNWARTPAEYCKHLNGSDPEFGRGKILPDGRKMGMYNLHPRFFDDSFVFVGAEKSAKVMTNLTDKMNGTNEYTDTLYPYKSSRSKTASFGESTREEEDKRRDAVLEKVRRPMPEATFEGKLSKLLAGQNLSGRERRAVDAFRQQALAHKDAFNQRQLSAAEFLAAQQFEHTEGVPLSQFDYLRERLGDQMAFVEQVKQSSVDKWAEMFKKLPAPTAAELAFVRAREGAMGTLSTACLDALAENPSENIRAAANLGVVLKPEEFQHILLKGRGGEKYKGKVFRPTPLEVAAGPDFDMRATDEKTTSKVKKVLEDTLEDRSFAPRMVRNQLDKRKNAPSEKLAECADPLLDEVSQLYNCYRGGIVAANPSWADIHPRVAQMSDLGKEAHMLDASYALSRALTALAFWPALGLG